MDTDGNSTVDKGAPECNAQKTYLNPSTVPSKSEIDDPALPHSAAAGTFAPYELLGLHEVSLG